MSWFEKLHKKWFKRQVDDVTRELPSLTSDRRYNAIFIIKVAKTYRGKFSVVNDGALEGGINIDPPVGTITPLHPWVDPAKLWPIWQLVDGHFISGVVYPELDEVMWDKEKQEYVFGGAPFSRLIKLPDLSKNYEKPYINSKYRDDKDLADKVIALE
jgi:hypothetical protein